jgi:phosphate transport system permease protein
MEDLISSAPESTHDRIARRISQVMFGVCILFTAFILSLLVMVTGYLISIGFSSISWTFFSQVAGGDPQNPGGMLHGIVGTIILVGLASLVGIPLGMLAGIYLAEYNVGSRIAAPVQFISDVLAGVPSIVVGILGYEFLVVPFSTGHVLGVPIPLLTHIGISGSNAWAGALALAFIMIPIVARTTEEMLLLVPGSYREASIALGATRAKTILQVVVPSATGSIVTGIMLAIARVAGETAPLLFTASLSRFLPKTGSDLNQAFPSLTVQIYKYATGPYPQFRQLAWAGILVLIALIFVLNVAIRYVTRSQRPAG